MPGLTSAACTWKWWGKALPKQAPVQIHQEDGMRSWAGLSQVALAWNGPFPWQGGHESPQLTTKGSQHISSKETSYTVYLCPSLKRGDLRSPCHSIQFPNFIYFQAGWRQLQAENCLTWISTLPWLGSFALLMPNYIQANVIRGAGLQSQLLNKAICVVWRKRNEWPQDH